MNLKNKKINEILSEKEIREYQDNLLKSVKDSFKLNQNKNNPNIFNRNSPVSILKPGKYYMTFGSYNGHYINIKNTTSAPLSFFYINNDDLIPIISSLYNIESNKTSWQWLWGYYKTNYSLVINVSMLSTPFYISIIFNFNDFVYDPNNDGIHMTPHYTLAFQYVDRPTNKLHLDKWIILNKNYIPEYSQTVNFISNIDIQYKDNNIILLFGDGEKYIIE